MPRRRVLPVTSPTAIKKAGSGSSCDRVLISYESNLSRAGADHSKPLSSNMGNVAFGLGRNVKNESHADESKASNGTDNGSSHSMPLQASSNGDLQSLSHSGTRQPALTSLDGQLLTNHNTVEDTITPSESCTSYSSSLKVPTKKSCPTSFQCTRCRGDVRMPPLGTEDSTPPAAGDTCSNVSSDEAEPVIYCSSPYCEAQYHVSASRCANDRIMYCIILTVSFSAEMLRSAKKEPDLL